MKDWSWLQFDFNPASKGTFLLFFYSSVTQIQQRYVWCQLTCVNALLVNPTWCDNCGHGHTFQMALGSEDTDVVLGPQIQALEHAWGLICRDKLFQGVPSLAGGWCACHSVACDACRGWRNMTNIEVKRKYPEETFFLVKRNTIQRPRSRLGEIQWAVSAWGAQSIFTWCFGSYPVDSEISCCGVGLYSQVSGRRHGCKERKADYDTSMRNLIQCSGDFSNKLKNSAMWAHSCINSNCWSVTQLILLWKWIGYAQVTTLRVMGFPRLRPLKMGWTL